MHLHWHHHGAIHPDRHRRRRPCRRPDEVQVPAASFDVAIDQAANGLADSVTYGLSAAVKEALGDPVVVALMAADRVDRSGVEAMLRRVGAALANVGPPPGGADDLPFGFR